MGDVITVYGDVDYDGFYRGKLGPRRGLVPSNFLRPSPHHQSAPLHHAHSVNSGRQMASPARPVRSPDLIESRDQATVPGVPVGIEGQGRMPRQPANQQPMMVRTRDSGEQQTGNGIAVSESRRYGVANTVAPTVGVESMAKQRKQRDPT